MENYTDDQFIKFGSILNQELREELIEYWNSKIIDNQFEVTLPLKKYTTVIDELFSDSFRRTQIQNSQNIHDELKSQIFLGFHKLGDDNIKNHPFVKEEIDLKNWYQFQKDLNKKKASKLFKNIKKYYSDDKFNLSFFESKFDEFDKKNSMEFPESNLRDIGVLKERIVERWDSFLQNKKDQWFMEELEKWRSKLMEEYYSRFDKLEEMMDLLAPFGEELGRFWDLSKGNWTSQGFDILRQHAELIRNQPEIEELAKYLGRMRLEREDMIQELITRTDFRTEYKPNKFTQEEIVGIHESNDINHLLPSELSLLNDETVETLFYLKFAEKKLLSYDFQGYEQFQEAYEWEEEVETSDSAEESGPIIICVDTSGSMHGVPERIAKTLCFAILRIALLEERQCYLISFSTGIETLELTNFQQNLPRLISFLAHSFHGGTDAAPALREAVKQVKTESYKNADVLMISDFIMGSLPADLQNQIKETKVDNVEYHSLVISNSGNKNALAMFDNNWFYKIGADRPFKDILEQLEELRNNKRKEKFKSK